MPLCFQIRVSIICPPPPLIRIGLTETSNSRWAKAHLAHPLTGSLHSILRQDLIRESKSLTVCEIYSIQ